MDFKVIDASAGEAGNVGSIPGSGQSPEQEMATHSSILAWKIPWSLAGYSSCGCKESDMTKRLRERLLKNIQISECYV